MEEELQAEKHGILAWLIHGAMEALNEGLNPPEEVLVASKEYQSEQDRVLQFITEECDIGVEYSEKLSTPDGNGLYPSYVDWCKNGGMHPLSKPKFLIEIQRHVPSFKKETKAMFFGDQRKEVMLLRGIRLKTETHPTHPT